MSQVLLNRKNKTLQIESSTSYVHVCVSLIDYTETKLKVYYDTNKAYLNCDSCVEYFAKLNNVKTTKIIGGKELTNDLEIGLRKQSYFKFNYKEFIERQKNNKF